MRAVERFFEILPGAAIWLTIGLLIFFSFRAPMAMAVFVLLYDLYWVLKIVYLSTHLIFSFIQLKKNLKVNWLDRLNQDCAGWKDIYHLILFPMYREPYALVRASFLALSNVNYPKEKLLVVLATEERGGELDQATAQKISAEFGKSFGAFLVSRHPAGVPGELAGKGSNESWAAREAGRLIIDARGIPYEKVLVSAFDIDTRPAKDYFAVLSYKYLKEAKDGRASFQPIPVFVNNIRAVPVFARLVAFTSTFWQLIQQARPEQLVTFSSHSVPFKALNEVGFWDTNVVSEDSRIFFKCLNYYNGNWKVVPMFYPIYMDAVAGKNFFAALFNLYRQQRRWAWGVENVPLFMKDFIKNKALSFRKKVHWFFVSFSGFYSWAVSSFIILVSGWLPIVFGGRQFRETLVSYNLPQLAGILGNLSMLGIVASAVVGLQLFAPQLNAQKFKRYIFYIFQWFLTPITVIIFGSLPAFEAQTRLMLGGRYRLGFWRTPKAQKNLE